jgi:uncharacterized membrane protein
MIAMVVLSIGVGLWSFRFAAVPWNIWPAIAPGIQEVVRHVPLQALTHMLIAPIALLVGPFQFIPQLRAKRPALHRWMGRTYVAACLIAGVGALAVAPYASGGPVASLGFGTLAVLWIAATAGAWRAAVRRDFALHRKLMLYSFAMTFGAVTLRLQIPLGIMFFGFSDYRSMSPWLSFTAWVPNVLAVWLYLQLMALGPPRTAAMRSSYGR